MTTLEPEASTSPVGDYVPEPGRHDPADVPLRVAIDNPEKVGVPDGVPHDVIGIAAYVSILIAASTLIAWLTVGMWLAIPVAVVGAFILLRKLPQHARKERRDQAIDAATHNWDAPKR